MKKVLEFDIMAKNALTTLLLDEQKESQKILEKFSRNISTNRSYLSRFQKIKNPFKLNENLYLVKLSPKKLNTVLEISRDKVKVIDIFNEDLAIKYSEAQKK
jgi:hypothetical protein